MSTDSKIIKSKTDFEVILNYSNTCIWKDLNSVSGAGANAACRVDKPFSAPDPLSEIVWSPDKGLSVKCVDSSFTNKKTSLLVDVEPSSMVLALLQSVTDGSSTTKKPMVVEPIAVICSKSDVSSTYTPTRHPASDSVVIIPNHKTCEDDHDDTGFGDNMEKFDTAIKTLPKSRMENVMNGLEKYVGAQTNIGTAMISEIKGNKSTISGRVDDERMVSNLLLLADEPKCSTEENPSPRNHCNGGIETGVVNQVVQIEDGLYTRVDHIIEYKGTGALGTNLISSGISPSQKLDSTAENDLQTFNYEATCAAKSRVFVSESNENKNKSQVNEMMLLCNTNLPVLPSPGNSRIHMPRKGGKEKSLSDGNSNLSLSKEDDFFISAENCHSSGLLLAVKKRCNFQQVIIGSKKVKRQAQETSYSKSNVQPDSSFMNLISNMIKGCSQSTQEEDKSLALNLENSNHHLLWPRKKLRTYNKNQDPVFKNAGFRSNFQSIVGTKFKNVGTRISQVGEASKDFELGKKIHGIDATPMTFCADNNIRYRKYRLSTKAISPLIVLDHFNERGGSEVHYTPCTMLPHSNEHVSLKKCKDEEATEQSADNQLLSEAHNLRNCCINKENSTVVKFDMGNQYHTAKPHKFINSFTPFPELRDSGTMVSMFARRLGAIKQFQHTA